MATMPKTKRYAAHACLLVGVLLAVPLWREFNKPAQPAWNVFLAAFLLALVFGSFLGIRYLQKKGVEVGAVRPTQHQP